jgi:streptomycin 3"-kinase
VPVTQGESGDKVYRRSDGAAYAKLASSNRSTSLDGERRRIAWLAATGLPTPRVLDWIQSDRGACLVTSPLHGMPASSLSPTELHKAWPSLARQLKAIHELPVEDCPFDRRLSTMFAQASEVVARGVVNPDFLALAHRSMSPTMLLDSVRAELPLRLAQESDDLVVCHGDASLPNFVVDPDTLRCTGLLDLGRLGLADRYVDLALITANARESWTTEEDAVASDAELFAIHGIVSPDRDRLDFYLRLDPLTWG